MIVKSNNPIRYVNTGIVPKKRTFNSDFNLDGESNFEGESNFDNEVTFSIEGDSEVYGNFNSDGENFYGSNFDGDDFDGDDFDGDDFDGADSDMNNFDGHEFDGDNFNGYEFDGDSFDGFSNARGKKGRGKFNALLKKMAKVYPPAIAVKMAKKALAKNKAAKKAAPKKKRKGLFSKGGFFDKGFADLDKKAGFSKAGDAIKNTFKKIATGAAKAMAKALGGSDKLKQKTDLFQKSGLGKKLDKKGTSLVRNLFRNLKINLGAVKIPIGPAVTLWANTKKGRKTLGKIPGFLGGYDLRKTFIFEGLNVEQALKKAALELGMGFTPLPGFASKKISDKAVKYKDTRDGFDGNSYDFDGLNKNKEFN